MTQKPRETTTTTVATKVDEKPSATVAPDPSETTDDAQKKATARRRPPGECVVDDGTAHMGRATPGADICSAHAMHYKADGTPR